MIPFPVDDEKTTAAGLSNGQLVIAANNATSHPNEAKTFITFLARPKQDLFFCEVAGCITGDDLRSGTFPAFVKPMVPYVTAGRVYYTPATGGPKIDKGIYNPNFITAFQGLFTGQRTIDQILQFADRLWDEP